MVVRSGFCISFVAWVALAGTAGGPDPSLEGTWEGAIRPAPGMELRVAFHVDRDDAGGLRAVMDSPDQGASGIPVASVLHAGDSIVLRLPQLEASYRGVRVHRDSIQGEWHQMGQHQQLDLVRGGARDPAEARPQEPETPAPYREEEVRFGGEGRERSLAGTLTLPEGGGPFPSVVLIHGSGPLDRNGTIMGHRPFLVLADHLSRNGVAVLRYDQRGVGRSEGDFWSATLEDLAADAATAVAFLHGRPEIDPQKIGVIGHSEGGLVGPMVAVEGLNLAFMVLLAPPGLPLSEGLLRQERAVARAMGATDREAELAVEMRSTLLGIVLEVDQPEERTARIEAALRRIINEAHAPDSLPFGVPGHDQERWIASQARAMAAPGFRRILMHHPPDVLREVRVPVLALFGGLDVQVPPADHLPVVQRALHEGRSPDVTVLELSGLNHLFQTAQSGAPSEYGRIPETFAPDALDTIASWIHERLQTGQLDPAGHSSSNGMRPQWNRTIIGLEGGLTLGASP